MKIEDKIFYNVASSEKLGWKPSWLGCDEFNENLIQAIEVFQKKYNLKIDGLLGPSTYTRLASEQQANYELNLLSLENKYPHTLKNYITCLDKKLFLPDGHNQLIGLLHSDALVLSDFSRPDGKRKIDLVVTHWDATLSARACHSILEKRKISTHFNIDNDGTIYQMVDLNDIAWHAGNSKINRRSVGIDFSNAYYMKYQNYYEKKGFGSRPIMNSTIHNVKLGEHLGYYDVQLAAYKQLLKVLHLEFGLPLECPMDSKGQLITGVYKPILENKFSGVCCHYHLTRNKIDCAGLDLVKLLVETKKELGI